MSSIVYRNQKITIDNLINKHNHIIEDSAVRMQKTDKATLKVHKILNNINEQRMFFKVLSASDMRDLVHNRIDPQHATRIGPTCAQIKSTRQSLRYGWLFCNKQRPYLTDHIAHIFLNKYHITLECEERI